MHVADRWDGVLSTAWKVCAMRRVWLTPYCTLQDIAVCLSSSLITIGPNEGTRR